MLDRKGSRGPKWDIYEAVILLDGYLKAVQKNVSLSKASRSVSEELRKMAVNRGESIDGSFRNEAGISFQIRKMESAFKGKTVSIPATSLFVKTVKLYREDKSRYKSLLKEARRMVLGEKRDSPAVKNNGMVNAGDFLKYLLKQEKIASRTCSAYVSCIRSSERFAKGHGYDSCRIFGANRVEIISTIRALYADKEFLDLNVKQHNRFSAAINKLMRFLEIQKDDVVTPNLINKVQPDTNTTVVSTPSAPSAAIERVLKKHFKYGFKKNSIRELMRFRRFADELNIKIPDDDNELLNEISLVGMVIEDKVFCVDKDIWLKLQEIVDDVHASGANVAFYEKLFENHSDLMAEYHIPSAEQFKAFLQVCVSDVYFGKNFMSCDGRVSEKDAITAEIIRVWGNMPIAKIMDVSSALPYIPIDCIRRVISGNSAFVWTSEGAYLYIDLFDISESDKSNIIKFVDEKYEYDSFVPIVDIPLESIADDNPDVPIHAVYNAVYNKVLSDKYCINGKILTLKNETINVASLLKRYISGKDECTFGEVDRLIKELTGYTDRALAFNALYDNMVRVDKNRFVSFSQVDFNIEEIDRILFHIIGNQFCAIKEIATFAMFPFCGQGWNHYLLESYCYKFSDKYSLRVLSFNDKNAGIISPKKLHDKYDTLLAMRLAQTNLELVPDVIGKYLCENGFTAKSKYAWLDDLAMQAKKFRKELN